MSEDQARIPDSLRQKFPHLKPVKGPPSLITMNGCGISLYGKRDFDAETRTYIKTRCICLVFVPLFALDAFRVADAGSRTWYFFGKETLSSFARSWNAVMACLLLLGGLSVGWKIHTDSPEYRAAQEIQRATRFMNTGNPLQAADIYRQQIAGPEAAAARSGLQLSLDACLQSDQPRTVAAAFRLLARLPAAANQPTPVLPDAAARGLAAIAKFRSQNPEGALEIFDQVALLKPEPGGLKPLRMALLQKCIAAAPDNTNRVVELALIYEADKQHDECIQLLLPYRQKLGATEGARILGQYLLEQGRHEDAYGLLFPYVQTRLEKLRTIERSYTNTIASVSKRALQELREGRADHTFYENYDRASKAAQEEMVDKYIQNFMQRDSSYQHALNDFKEANQIVGVALDLGIVQLNRAQSLKTAAGRKAELEAAEKTFLAIRGFAGDTDEYQLFLGQVYYWLGKSKEGRELFDQLLARHQRAYPILMSLGSTLREVGDHAAARTLAEEAYQTGKAGEQKFGAATFRALLFKDTDDQIAWLEKSDTKENWIQIELNSARGKKALQQGNKMLAAGFLQKAISGYDLQTKTAASLNNCGLACFDLYEATGNIADHRRGMTLLEEAIRLSPSDSILLNNTVHCLITRAVMEVVGDSIHTEALGESASLALLAHLYQNDAERAQVYQKLRDTESMKKALAYLDKALLLAPKNHSLCSLAVSLQSSFRDLGELQKLQQRFHTTAPDLVEVREEMLGLYNGENRQQRLDEIEAGIKMLETQLTLPAVKDHPPTYEHVAVSLVRQHQAAWVYGGAVDSGRMLQLAQAALQQHPSSASQHALKAVYLFRAGEELGRQNPEYAAMLERTRRVMSPDDLLILMLERGGSPAQVLRQNEDMARALALEKEACQSFPAWINVDEWALFRNLDPATAQKVAPNLKGNEACRLADELEFQLNPLSSSSVLEQFWRQKLAGDDKHAGEIYQEAVRQGVPLPTL